MNTFTIKYLDGRKLSVKADSFREAVEKSKADLFNANLAWTDLTGTILTGANIDFSCWPIWCHALNAVIDERIARQLLCHVLRAMQSVDTDAVKELLMDEKLIKFDNGFRHVDDFGRLEIKRTI